MGRSTRTCGGGRESLSRSRSAVVVAGWLARRRALGWLALLAAFFVLVLPTGGLGQSGPQTSAERYTYQPGWVLTFAVGLAIVRRPALIPNAPGSCGRLVGAAPAVALLVGARASLDPAAGGLARARELSGSASWKSTRTARSGNFQLGRYYAGQRRRGPTSPSRASAAAFAVAPEYVDARHALGLSPAHCQPAATRRCGVSR